MPGLIVDSKLDTRGTLASLPCALPQSPIPHDCDAQSVVDQFAEHLSALREDDFTKDALWRDSFALTGTLRTFYSSSAIVLTWRKLSLARKVDGLSKTTTPARIVRLPRGSCWVEGTFEFRTAASPASLCTLVVTLTLGQDGSWKIWMLGTILQQLLGVPSPDELSPGTYVDVQNVDTQAAGGSDQDPLGCVVVGAGQAGLSTAGRLKALGLSYVVLDKHPNVGDSWKLRYDSARLHTTRQWAHLPFDRTFPSSCQEFLTKDDLATGHQAWVKKFGINVWNSAELVSGSWDSKSKRWILVARCGMEERSLVTRSIVLATGPGGTVPSMPSVADQDSYHGENLHSVDFKSAEPWKGRRCIVVGTANTAHDVARDMVEAGCSSVTMIQRSRTYVMPADSWAPIPAIRLMSMELLNSQAEQESERFDALEKAGFHTQRYGDILHQIYERSGGHYMDVGASAMIAQGKIKVKAGVTPIAYTETGLRFSDGTSLDAEVVVWATGFKSNTRQDVQDLFGASVAEQVDDYWGVDAEGELRGAFKPCGHPGLWLHGGTQGQARYMSRFVALQIKALVMGQPLPVYSDTPKMN